MGFSTFQNLTWFGWFFGIVVFGWFALISTCSCFDVIVVSSVFGILVKSVFSDLVEMFEAGIRQSLSEFGAFWEFVLFRVSFLEF